MFCATSKSQTSAGKAEGTQWVHLSAGVAALAVVLTIVAMLGGAPQSNAAGGCGDLQVVGLAGSGELGDKKTAGTDSLGLTNTDFYDKLVASYRGSSTQVTEHGVPYLDQSVPYFEFHQSYSTSKQSGVDNALKYLNNFCTTTKIVLVGYSQGADVVMEVYSELSAAQKDRVVSVILFADPNFNPQSHPLDQGTYTQRPTGQGIWGARPVPASPPDFQSIARSYCLVKDPICNSTLTWSTAYSCAIGDATKISCLKALPELQHLLIGCRIGFGVDSLDCPHYAYRETGMTLLAALFVKKLFPPKSSLDHLVISPNPSTITAGGEQRYSVEGFDAAGASTGDITASTTFSIAPDGSCTGAVCTASSPGPHTVTGASTGVIGTATLDVQPLPQGLTGVESITLDLFGESVYAVKTDGTVWAWGANTAGKLGNGTTTNSTVPVQVAGLTGVRNVLANGYSAVALKTDGTVWAWGNNGNGELGNGTMTDSAVPVQVTGLTGAQSIAFANETVIAVKSDRTVWAWGDNSAGQLGNGTASWPGSSVPVQVTGLSDVQNVTIAEDTPLAVKTDGTVWAWGSGANGLLGNGATSGSSVPVQVNNLINVQSITTNGFTALALKTDGTVWAWGHANLLGNGDTTGLDSSTPAQITGLTGVKNITAQGYSAFAVKTDGSVWAWGAGPTGSGSVSVFSAVPVQVPAMTGVQSMACDGSSAFAVKTDGTVWAWGSNLAGVLGIGNTNESLVPVQVTALSGVLRITTRDYSAFAVKNDGTVWAWGLNSLGQLGVGTTTDSHIPVRVG